MMKNNTVWLCVYVTGGGGKEFVGTIYAIERESMVHFLKGCT